MLTINNLTGRLQASPNMIRDLTLHGNEQSGCGSCQSYEALLTLTSFECYFFPPFANFLPLSVNQGMVSGHTRSPSHDSHTLTQTHS